ncbi:MAG: cation diffusion facilitator family transporter [Gemmatimonadota bacterium]
MSARTVVGPTPPEARPDARRSSVRRILRWVLAANLLVIAAKAVVGWRTGSIAVLGDAGHSGVDALNNVVGLLAVRVAAEPPDAEHPYGHGKFETLGALAVVSFLSITCFELIRSAVLDLATGGAPPELGPVAFGVLGATAAVNVAVAWAEARYGRELDSEMLRADSRHTAADVLVTLAVIGGLALVEAGWRQGDAWLALLVAAVIAWSGWQILKETVPVLVDRRALDPDRIRRFVTGRPEVREATEIRSRGRPGEAFAELTIRVDADKNVRDAHGVAHRVEEALKREAGFRDVVVHVEPVPREAEGDPDREVAG